MHGRKTHNVSCILFVEDGDDGLWIGEFGLVDRFGVCIYCLLLYPEFYSCSVVPGSGSTP